MEDVSAEVAQDEFRALVESRRDRTLRHLRRDITVDICSDSAVPILDSIINHGDRDA